MERIRVARENLILALGGECICCGEKNLERLEIHEKPWYKAKYGKHARGSSTITRTKPFREYMRSRGRDIPEELRLGAVVFCKSCHHDLEH